MLVYHPSFDIYHTAFRILKVLCDNPKSKVEIDRMRIFDFIILFPHELKNITIPEKAEKGIKSLFRETRFNKLPDRKIVFKQIKPYFDLSIQCLITRKLIDIDLFKQGVLKINAEYSSSIKENFKEDESIEYIVLDFLYSNFLDIPLTELKKRTDLIEYRYDIVENK